MARLGLRGPSYEESRSPDNTADRFVRCVQVYDAPSRCGDPGRHERARKTINICIVIIFWRCLLYGINILRAHIATRWPSVIKRQREDSCILRRLGNPLLLKSNFTVLANSFCFFYFFSGEKIIKMRREKELWPQGRNPHSTFLCNFALSRRHNSSLFLSRRE